MLKTKLQHFLKTRQIAPDKRRSLQTDVYQFVTRNSANISDGRFKTIANADLGLLFQITDELFFDGMLGGLCEEASCKPLSFRLSTRMTSAGGMTTMQQSRRSKTLPEFEIAVATTPLFDTFKVDTSAQVGGVTCHDRLEALQRIMEHEMVHLAELLLFKDSSCAAPPFKDYSFRFFGHTESNHRLLTPRDIAKKQLGISTGDQVNFTVDGYQYSGFVNRITKRATVLVRDPKGTRYNDGKRYSKYYVPLTMLRPTG